MSDPTTPGPDSLKPTIRLNLPDAETPGERIGRYKLLQLIGEGGMGSVWMAEQEEPVRRRVALKVIKLGMDTKQVIGRFEAERQALALMDHPNIAKVLDAGATENGRPFFAMELVKGIPITKYCDDHKLGTEERLKLFTDVCHAIQHAHQKGIIHRDIKPSNILVTLNDGVPMPKVIDFGIAKATTGQALTDKTVFTAFEQFIGTPAYMSPEQAEMNSLDIDTRSDIYALGVLLYELLTGKTPFDPKVLLAKGLDEIRRIIREEEPPRPSTRLSTLEAAEQTILATQRHSEPPKLLGIIRGDLDWIVMKTLEKDRTRRYDTANGLAMDLQRYLNDEPIVARPPSQLYRFQKMVRRNKLTFTSALVITTALVCGIAVSLSQATRAKRAEQAQIRLRQEAEQARTEEAGARKRFQEKSEQLAELLSQLEQKQISEIVETEGPAKALACLADALRRNPDNQRAAYRLFSILSHNNVARLVSSKKFEGRILDTSYTTAGALILAGKDRDLSLWEYRSDKPIAGPLRQSAAINAASFSRSGQRVFITLAGGQVEVFRTTNLVSPVCSIQTGPGWSIAAVNADETRLMLRQTVAGSYTTLMLQAWDLSDGKPLTGALRYDGGQYGTSINFSEDSGRVFINEFGAPGRTRCTLDIAAGTIGPREPLGNQSYSDASPAIRSSVYVSEEGQGSVTTLNGHHSFLLPLASISIKNEHQNEPALKVSSDNISPDGRELLTVSKDGLIRLWDVSPHATVPLRIVPRNLAASAALNTPRFRYYELTHDGQKLLTLDEQGVAEIRDTRTGVVLISPVAEAGTVQRIKLSPEGTTAIAMQTNGNVRIWDLKSGKPVTGILPVRPSTKPVEQKDAFQSFAYSSDGSRVVANWTSGLAQVWDARTGNPLAEVPPNSLPSRARLESASNPSQPDAVLSQDGHRLVTAREEQTVRIWNATTGAAISPPLKHEMISYCRFSPNGTKLLTVGRSEAWVWDVESGQMLHSLKHDAEIVALRFSPEGDVFTFSTDRTFRVWNVTTGVAMRTVKFSRADELNRYYSPDGMRAVFSEDCHRLIVQSDGLRIWDLTTDTPLTAAIPVGDSDSYVSTVFLERSLSPAGGHIVYEANGVLRVIELPTVHGSAPAWLPALVESLACLRINQQGYDETIAPEEFIKTRSAVMSLSGNDHYLQWAKWILAESKTRTLSPFSLISLEQHIQNCLSENSPSSLQEVLNLAPLNVNALAAYLKHTGAGVTSVDESRYPSHFSAEDAKRNLRNTARSALAKADFLIASVPDNSTAWHIKARALNYLNQSEEAMVALDRSDSKELGPVFWETKAAILEKLSRTNEASAALDEAITAAKSRAPHLASSQYALRSAFFKRQGRLLEAGRDFSMAIGIPPRDTNIAPRFVDLSLSYSVALSNVHRARLSWPMSGVFADLIPGLQSLAGIPFDVRGVIIPQNPRTYYDPFRQAAASNNATVLPIGLRAKALHFLHGADSAYAPAKRIGKYTIRYMNQKSDEVSILIGRHLQEYRYHGTTPIEASEAPLAWVGLNETAKRSGLYFTRVYAFTWTNPLPDIEIRSVDFESERSSTGPIATPLLLAITADIEDAASQVNPQTVSAAEKSLATIELALQRNPDFFGYLHAKARLLSRLNRTNEALTVFSTLVTNSQALGDAGTNLLAIALRGRTNLLRQMSRPAKVRPDPNALRAEALTELRSRVGDEVTVEGKVQNVSLTVARNGANIEFLGPEDRLLMIWVAPSVYPDVTSMFSDDLAQTFQNRIVRATGWLANYGGSRPDWKDRLQINLASPEDLLLVTEPPSESADSTNVNLPKN